MNTFDVRLADGEHQRIAAERVFVADGSLMLTVNGEPVEIFAMGEWLRVSAAPIPQRPEPQPATPPRILSNATDIERRGW